MMELQQHEEVKSTTRYWGYRELTAAELLNVSGGDDGDGGGDGDDGGGDTSDGVGGGDGDMDSSYGEGYGWGDNGIVSDDTLYAGFWRDVTDWITDNFGRPPPDRHLSPTLTSGIRG